MFSFISNRGCGVMGRLVAVVGLSVGLATYLAAQDTKSIDDMVRQAQTMLSKGQPKDAASLLRKAIDAAPDRAELYMLRSRALDQTGKYDAAIDDASKYIQLEPTDPFGYLNRARVYLSMEKKESALQDANKAIELAPTEPDGYYRRSDIYYDMGRDSDGKADETKAEELEKQARS